MKPLPWLLSVRAPEPGSPWGNQPHAHFLRLLWQITPTWWLKASQIYCVTGLEVRGPKWVSWAGPSIPGLDPSGAQGDSWGRTISPPSQFPGATFSLVGGSRPHLWGQQWPVVFFWCGVNGFSVLSITSFFPSLLTLRLHCPSPNNLPISRALIPSTPAKPSLPYKILRTPGMRRWASLQVIILQPHHSWLMNEKGEEAAGSSKQGTSKFHSAQVSQAP